MKKIDVFMGFNFVLVVILAAGRYYARFIRYRGIEHIEEFFFYSVVIFGWILLLWKIFRKYELDAAVLAEELRHAQARGESIAEQRVLERYERRRMPHNLAMMAAMEGFQRLFQDDRLPLRWLRNAALKQVDRHFEAKALFVRRALGLSGDVPELAKVVA